MHSLRYRVLKLSQKYKARKKIVDAFILNESGEGGDGMKLAKWRRYKRVVETLGLDGQSDEESSYDEIGGTQMEIFKVYRLGWRANSVTEALHAIDEEGFTMERKKVKGKGGAKPAPRKHVPEECSFQRRAVEELPRALYRKEWLAEQGPLTLSELKIDDSAFDWD
ncbi:hypothetical protein V5O48_017538 [Marasmius crinis-equi]|uniref:Transposase n=1 Tax=Marasmius crinis-equi TaxID=585013 RepID=A0ABR3ENP2_9AGAR